ncbi:MAG: NINE protein [Blastocatellia bacterium]|nr:NINE protein [Blastocatellia bacterium]
MQCQKCGYFLSVTATYCPSCGLSVHQSPSNPVLEQRPDMLFDNQKVPINSPGQSPLPYSNVPSPLPPHMIAPDNYFLFLNGQQMGPYTVNQLRSMWHQGAVNLSTQYWQVGMTGWQPLVHIKHFLDSPAVHQPNTFVNNNFNQNMVAPMMMPMRSSRSRVAYILLAFFLGCFGIHNFYAGYSGRGIAQLLITLFLGWLGIGIIITAIWSFIEIVTVSRDAEGLKM